MGIEALLAELDGRVIPTPDGELRLGRRPPASPEAVEAFLARLPRPLVGSYLDLLRLSDGLDLYGVEIFGVAGSPNTNPEDVEELVKRRMVPFHDWGNGDFDCLDLTKQVEGETPVAFWSEELGNPFPITHNFERWARSAVVEIERFGRLLHPRDYATPRYADAQGVYESIANVKKTFYGDGDVKGRVEGPPPPVRKRDRVLGLLRRTLGRG